MELDILRSLYSMHNDVLDAIMVFITHLGDAGILWIVLSIVLLCFKKTRKIGVASSIALVLSLIFTNGIVKNLVNRARPYTYDSSIKLLIGEQSDASFPSGHTSGSFASAVAIFCYNKKWGALALIMASLIAFSRLYLFVHFPTDVLGGAVLGAIYAITGVLVVKFLSKKYDIKWM